MAYGTLTQLVLENQPQDRLNKFIHLYQKLGLPTTLVDMKLDQASRDDLVKVGQLANQEGETIHQMAESFTAEDIADALIAVDAYVKSLDA